MNSFFRGFFRIICSFKPSRKTTVQELTQLLSAEAKQEIEEDFVLIALDDLYKASVLENGIDKIDFKKVRKLLKTKSVSFANSEEVLKVTNCEVGGVPPFGNLFKIPVYIDKNLLENKKIDFNAGKQTVSIEMNLNDYIKIVKPEVEDFTR